MSHAREESTGHYLEFETNDGGQILIEVDRVDVASPSGVQKAGLRDRRAEGTLVRAQAGFEEVLRAAVDRSVSALADAIGSLEQVPAEVELTFGLKATGEIGNIAIAKAGGEANFTVRLSWRPEPT